MHNPERLQYCRSLQTQYPKSWFEYQASGLPDTKHKGKFMHVLRYVARTCRGAGQLSQYSDRVTDGKTEE